MAYILKDFEISINTYKDEGFPHGSAVNNLPANLGDVGWIPGLGRAPGEWNGNPLQYFSLGNPMDRGAWWAPLEPSGDSQGVGHDLATKQQQQNRKKDLSHWTTLILIHPEEKKFHYSIDYYFIGV